MITIPLRILLVEDVKTDAELIIWHINKIVEFPHVKVVDDLEDFELALQSFVPDVVISDYNLPTSSGIEIFESARSTDDSIPFIFLTGTIEDEVLASNTFLAGASGFILKKHMDNLDAKLGPLLKQIVFNMVGRTEIREKVRQNKIAVNQIYNYLDNLNVDTEEQRENIIQIRKNIENIKSDAGKVKGRNKGASQGD
ncbi:response regulator [Antarcticibacterium sp. 1MA-6-2]|uniref:response regulator n=1 Tax=Antarcticibacterium sp. 1MA-6-2 TaxID=2908210 RepID=UPI001F1939B8|nr:response regulator [Antarcticibacterium sp. 1MA-6-2]UJH91361.1 response regulator [Antarcticibacterium sp. 1MA-6-2]